MLSRRMPFRAVPCRIWLPMWGPEDEFGNSRPEYLLEPDIETTCVYAPGDARPDTSDDIEDGRPYGAVMRLTFFLPKTLDADLRQALIACAPADDETLASKVFKVVGAPTSYPRANTPGDYSWRVEGVEHLG